MCWFGSGGDTEDERVTTPDEIVGAHLDSLGLEKGQEGLAAFVLNHGGWDAFESREHARRAWQSAKDRGAFTDATDTPGDPADTPIFQGPRIETNRTGPSDLKTLPQPTIAIDKSPAGQPKAPTRDPDGPTLGRPVPTIEL